jgi:putative phage-type endonuclease
MSGPTQEELKLIGGSDAAAVAGIHPRKSPIDVWRRIVEGVETEENRAMRRGTMLEPIILRMYQEDTGYQLLGGRKFKFKDWGRASLDEVAKAHGDERGVEAKSVNSRMAHLYGDGPDDVPIEHLCQVQFYMAVSGIPVFDVVPFLGGDDIKVYTVHSDAEMQEMLFESCERFWRDNIIKKVPPPVDGSYSYSAWLQSRYPANRMPMKNEPDLAPYAVRLFEVREQIDKLETEEKAIKHRFMAAIGEAEGVEGPNFKVTWRHTKGKTAVDYDALIKEAAVPQQLVEKHTRIGAGYRRFLPTQTGVKK